jgi:hypothetical protein
MKVLFTLIFFSIDFLIILGSKVVIDLVFKTVVKLTIELPSKAQMRLDHGC